MRVLLLLAALVFLVPHASNAQAGSCGDVNGDGLRTYSDLTSLAAYLFDDSPAPDSLWAADIDGLAGVTMSDYQDLIGYLFVYFGGMIECTPVSGPFAASNDDTTYIRNTFVAPAAQQQVVEIWHKTDVRVPSPIGVDGLTGYSFPFSYACSTSAITLDSIVPRFDANIVRGKSDSVNQKALFAFSTFIGVGNTAFGGKAKLADLYFTIATPDPVNEQRILIDTTDFGPSHTFVASEEYAAASRPQIYGIVGTDAQPPTCCLGETGDVSGDGKTTLTDLTMMINSLFVSFEPLPCPAEGNTNGDQDCLIGLTDISNLVNKLFITFWPLAQCDSFDNFICGGQ